MNDLECRSGHLTGIPPITCADFLTCTHVHVVDLLSMSSFFNFPLKTDCTRATLVLTMARAASFLYCGRLN